MCQVHTEEAGARGAAVTADGWAAFVERRVLAPLRRAIEPGRRRRAVIVGLGGRLFGEQVV